MKSLFFLVLYIFSMLQTNCFAKAAEATVKIRAIAGDEEFGSFANSVLIEGKKSLILVDTQRTVLNAKRVVQEIKTSGKTLTYVFITHAHPDHFLAGAVIRDAFPNAQFIATPAVTKILLRDAEKMRSAISNTLKEQKASDEIPVSVVIPNAVVGNIIPFEDTAIKVREVAAGESDAAGILILPQLKTIVAGDVVYNHVHLWLHDGRFKEWKQNLKDLQRISGIETIFPGHGLSAKPSILDENIKYIDDFESTLKSSKAPTAAIEKMQQMYPEFKMKRFLSFGVEALFEKR
jgi:glyoxylase-like metal-dependent hydrolase (beta-lactamase superfamily II)